MPKRLIVLYLLFLHVNMFANEKLFECTKVFEQRREELILELERIDEQKQALDALKSATDELLKRKEAKLVQKEEAINNKLSIVEAKEKNIQKMLDEKRKILEEINTKKMDNVAQTFAKMKAASAANILSDMNISAASKLLRVQKPKTVGKILSKMDAKKASDITLELSKEIK